MNGNKQKKWFAPYLVVEIETVGVSVHGEAVFGIGLTPFEKHLQTLFRFDLLFLAAKLIYRPHKRLWGTERLEITVSDTQGASCKKT